MRPSPCPPTDLSTLSEVLILPVVYAAPVTSTCADDLTSLTDDNYDEFRWVGCHTSLDGIYCWCCAFLRVTCLHPHPCPTLPCMLAPFFFFFHPFTLFHTLLITPPPRVATADGTGVIKWVPKSPATCTSSLPPPPAFLLQPADFGSLAPPTSTSVPISRPPPLPLPPVSSATPAPLPLSPSPFTGGGGGGGGGGGPPPLGLVKLPLSPTPPRPPPPPPPPPPLPSPSPPSPIYPCDS